MKLMSQPESSQTFQMTFPDNGFAGLVLKPWGERKRSVFRDGAGSCSKD